MEQMDKKKRRLRGMRTYLAGAMDRVPDGGVEWRERITPMLNSMGVVVMNPCNKPFHMPSEDFDNRRVRHDHKRNGQLEATRRIMKRIRTSDLRMVDISDFIIASIDVDVHMCGSYEEITTANRQKKPVLCWVQQGRQMTPDWLLGMLPSEFFFDTVHGLLDYLRHVHSAPQVKTYRRWYFPKFEMLYSPTVLGALESGV